MNKAINHLIADHIRMSWGYIDNPDAIDGPTKHGISLKTLEAWYKQDLTAGDVHQLTEDEAEAIYKNKYFLRPGFNNLPERIQPVMCDMAMDKKIGPQAAISLLQKIITEMGTDIEIDGHVGPQTRQAAVIICNVYPHEVLNYIAVARIAYYHGIVAHDPNQQPLLAGWINRAERFAA